MTTEKDWLQNLKSGDKVLLSSAHSRWYSVDTVKSVSEKRGDIVLVSGKKFSSNGYEKGVTWNGDTLLEYNQRNLDYSNSVKQRQDNLSTVKAFDFSKLSNEDLAKVAELLKGR